jgi:fucose permease
VGRFTSGLLAKKYSGQKIIALGQMILLPAILLLILPLKGTVPAAAAMFLIGFGNGPVFPNMVHITPENFENSQSAMGVQMSAGYIGVLASPLICGALAKIMDFKLFGWYLLVLFLLFSTGIYLLGKYSKKNK